MVVGFDVVGDDVAKAAGMTGERSGGKKKGKKKGKKSKSSSSDVRECDSTASWDKSLNRECIYSTHPGDF